MHDNTTLLLTSTPPALVAELARHRPEWQIIALEDTLPAEPLTGKIWAYIDWLCPTMSGLEMCRRLREAPATRSAHLTLVLDDTSPEMKRRALQAGADDYIPGPLDAKQVLQRTGGAANKAPLARHRLLNGPILLDRAAHRVCINGQPVTMRPNEFRLLEHFMDNLDQVFGRSALIESLGKDGEMIDERTVDVWVGRLRRVLASHGVPDQLRTVRTMGYVMDSRDS